MELESIARLAKEALLIVEQTRLHDEVWLPKRVNIRYDARLAILKHQADSRILSGHRAVTLNRNTLMFSLEPSDKLVGRGIPLLPHSKDIGIDGAERKAP